MYTKLIGFFERYPPVNTSIMSSTDVFFNEIISTPLPFVNSTMAPDRQYNDTGTMAPRPHYNDTGIISQQATDQIFFALNCVCYPIIFLLGTTGNIISIIVMVLQGLHHSTNVILVALAVADTVQLTLGVVEKAPCIISRYSDHLGANIKVSMYPQVMMLRLIFVRITSYITMLIAIERTIAVVVPFKAKILLSVNRIRIVVVVLYICLFLSAVPTLLIFNVSYVSVPTHNESVAMLQLSAFYMRYERGMDMYMHVFNNIILRYLPFLVVCCCSLAIVINLRIVRFWNLKSGNIFSTERIRRERKITKMAMSITSFYLLCMVPIIIHQLWLILDDNFGLFKKLRNSFLVISEIASIFEALNSATNFIFYVLMSEKFAETLKTLFCCKPKRVNLNCPPDPNIYNVGNTNLIPASNTISTTTSGHLASKQFTNIIDSPTIAQEARHTVGMEACEDTTSPSEPGDSAKK